MTLEEKIIWSDKRGLSVRLFNAIIRTWFFDTDCNVMAQLNLLEEMRQGLIRNAGKKCLRELQEVIAITLSDKAGYNKIKSFTEYVSEGFTEQEAPLVRRHDVLYNLWLVRAITEDEKEEMSQLSEVLKL